MADLDQDQQMQPESPSMAVTDTTLQPSVPLLLLSECSTPDESLNIQQQPTSVIVKPAVSLPCSSIKASVPSYSLPSGRQAQSIMSIRMDPFTWISQSALTNSDAYANRQAVMANSASRLGTSMPKSSDDVVVIVPGSRYVKIGMSKDPLPKLYPNCIAYPRIKDDNNCNETFDDLLFFSPLVDKSKVDHLLDTRHRLLLSVKSNNNSKTISQNSVRSSSKAETDLLNGLSTTYKSITSYNHSQGFKPETFKREANGNGEILVKKSGLLVGQEALDSTSSDYRLVWPMQYGHFKGKYMPNSTDGDSISETLTDQERFTLHVRETAYEMVEIWFQILARDFLSLTKGKGKEESEESKAQISCFRNLGLVLVIPDAWTRVEIRAIVDELLRRRQDNSLSNFSINSLNLIQEPVAAMYGAGITSALVIDMGHSRTSIVAVEDGTVVQETRTWLPIGGESLCRYLLDMLRVHGFRAEEAIDAHQAWVDFCALAHGRMLSLNEEEFSLTGGQGQTSTTVGISGPLLFEFTTSKTKDEFITWPLKAWEERIMVPLMMFEPGCTTLLSYALAPTHQSTRLVLPCDQTDLTDYYSEEVARVKRGDESANEQTDQETPQLAMLECLLCKHLCQNHADYLDHLDHMHNTEATNEVLECPKCRHLGSSFFKTFLDFKCHLLSHALNQKPNKRPKRESTSNPWLELNLSFSKLALDQGIENALSNITDTVTPISTVNPDRNTRLSRLSSNLLIVGGCASIPRLIPMLTHRLSIDGNSAPMQFVLNTKDMDPRTISWKGASVIGRMDDPSVIGEQWISAWEWTQLGDRILKERLPFPLYQ